MKLLATLAMLLTASATATPPTVALSGIQKREPIKWVLAPPPCPPLPLTPGRPTSRHASGPAGNKPAPKPSATSTTCSASAPPIKLPSPVSSPTVSCTYVMMGLKADAVSRKIDTCSLGDSAAILARVCQGGFGASQASPRGLAPRSSLTRPDLTSAAARRRAMERALRPSCPGGRVCRPPAGRTRICSIISSTTTATTRGTSASTCSATSRRVAAALVSMVWTVPRSMRGPLTSRASKDSARSCRERKIR